MSCRCVALGLSLLGALATAPAAICAENAERPLQLRLAASPMAMAPARPALMLRGNNAAVPSSARRVPTLVPVQPSLGQRALQSVLEPVESFEATAPTTGPATDQFKFHRQGPAIRDLRRGYKDMCANVSGKIWDEPNGRRIKFDSEGKPGIAVVIPIR